MSALCLVNPADFFSVVLTLQKQTNKKMPTLPSYVEEDNVIGPFSKKKRFMMGH